MKKDHILIRPSFVDVDTCCLCRKFREVYSGSDGHRFCQLCRDVLIEEGIAFLGGQQTTTKHDCHFFFGDGLGVADTVIDQASGVVSHDVQGVPPDAPLADPDLAWTQKAPTAKEVEDKLNQRLFGMKGDRR